MLKEKPKLEFIFVVASSDKADIFLVTPIQNHPKSKVATGLLKLYKSLGTLKFLRLAF